MVGLAGEGRSGLHEVVKKLEGTSQEVRGAKILLKGGGDGKNRAGDKNTKEMSCQKQAVENVRRRLVTEGLDAVLNRKKRETPPRPKILDGKQEAEIIALRLGKPPAGFANWTLRLLANQIVELEIADSISPETVRRTLKKTE